MKQPAIERIHNKQGKRDARRQAARSGWHMSLPYAIYSTGYTDVFELEERDQIDVAPAPVDCLVVDSLDVLMIGPVADEWERTIRSRDLPSIPSMFKFEGHLAAGAEPHIGGLVPLVEPAVEERFAALAYEWLAATEFTSSSHELILHPAYQQIIGLGKPALPLIIQQLDDSPRQWFWALRSIAGEDPAAGLSSVPEAVAAWRRWAFERGYVGEY